MTDETTGTGGLRSTLGKGGSRSTPVPQAAPDGGQAVSPHGPPPAAWPSPNEGPWEPSSPQPQPQGGPAFGEPNQTFAAGPPSLGPPAPNPSGSGSGRPKWLLPLGLIVVLVGAGAFFLLRGGDGGSSSSGQGSGQVSMLGRGPEGRLEEQWSQRMDGYPSSVAIHDGTVFVAEGDDSDRVTIRALDLGGDGAERWEKSFRGGGYDSWLHVHSGLLLLSTEGEITAVDPGSGEERWSEDGGWTGLDLADLVLVSNAGESVAYELNGDRRWRTRGYAIGACDGLVLINDDDAAVAVRDRDGSESWEVDGRFVSCGGGTAFVHDDDRVRAIELSSGDERWNARVSNSSVLAHDGSVVIRDGDETVGYRVSDGEELWSHDSDDVGSPVGVSGSTVITFGDGSLRKINPASGDEVERARVGNSAEGVFVGENIALVVEEESFTAYALSNLDELWDIDVDGYHQPWSIEHGWLVISEGDEVVAYR